MDEQFHGRDMDDFKVFMRIENDGLRFIWDTFLAEISIDDQCRESMFPLFDGYVHKQIIWDNLFDKYDFVL